MRRGVGCAVRGHGGEGPRYSPTRRWLLLTSLLLSLAACHSWRPTTASPQMLIADERPSEIRITLADGSVRMIRSPQIVSDSIVGSTEFGLTRAAAMDLRTVEVRRFNVLRTAGLVAAHVGLVLGVSALVIYALPHYHW